MGENDIFHLLSREYFQFTSAEKRVADFIISNGTRAQTMSISELAEATGVAEATISRFCRRLNFNGFAAFKLAIAASEASRANFSNPLTGEVTHEDTIPSLAHKLAGASMDAIQETETLVRPSAIQSAADILLQADKVLCMGQGGSMLIAREAAHLFSTVSNKFWPVEDSHLQAIAASTMESSDVLFFFSYSGSTRDVLEIAAIARERGAKVVLVTRFPNSPGAQQADYVLQCGANESPMQSGSIAARIAQMYLLDVLFSEFSRMDMDRALEYRRRIAEALKSKHM